MKTTLTRIHGAIDWYEKHSSTEDIEGLINARDVLAVLSFRLAEMVGDNYGQYNESYYIRIIETSAKINTLRKSKMAINQAEHETREQLRDHYKREKDAETIAHKSSLILKQVNKILEAMSQRIAFMREEQQSANYQS